MTVLVQDRLRLSRDQREGPSPRTSLAVLAVVGAVAAGAGVAWAPLLAVGAAGGLVFTVLLVRDPVLALALWIPSLFLEAVPALNLAGKGAGLLLLLAALRRLIAGDPGPRRALDLNRPLVASVLLVLAWTFSSVVWAADPGTAFGGAVRWLAVVLVFALVASSLDELRSVQLVALAYVGGGVLSLVLGLASGPTSEGNGPARLGGSAGDPNFLGSWLLSSALLALGLMALARRQRDRVLLGGVVALLLTGMGLTLSRGTFVAAGVVGATAVLVMQGRRRGAGLALVVGLAAIVTWLSSSSLARNRVLGGGDKTSGRTDLWTIAWQMVVQHPWRGVGLDNYVVRSSEYMRDVHPISTTYLVVRTAPDQVHNVYLQLLAEGGIPLLVLVLVFVLFCLRATLVVARRFDASGRPREALFVYSVLLAQVSMLAAALFLSSSVDKRLWLLLALGPALTVAFRRREADA